MTTPFVKTTNNTFETPQPPLGGCGIRRLLAKLLTELHQHFAEAITTGSATAGTGATTPIAVVPGVPLDDLFIASGEEALCV